MDAYAGVKLVVQQIISAQGEVSASQLVDASRPRTSPSHNAFEWNDAKAGEEYRLWQARGYLRRISVTTSETQQEAVRLINIPPADSKVEGREGRYKPITDVVQIEDEYERALRQLKSQLDKIQFAYEELLKAGEKKNVKVPKMRHWIDSMRETLNEARI